MKAWWDLTEQQQFEVSEKVSYNGGREKLRRGSKLTYSLN